MGFAGTAGGAATGSMFGPWGALIGAGIGLFGDLFGAHMQSKGADQVAEIAAAAARYTADLQAKATADALAFEKASAENSFLNSEAARKGNYGFTVAREHRLGSLGEEVGMAPREIPDYVPGVDPNFTGAPRAGVPSGTPAPAVAGGGAGIPVLPTTFDPAAVGALYKTAYTKGQTFNPQYWASVWPGLVQRGQQLNDPTYAAKRVLGWQGTGADAPDSGPFAGGAAVAPSMWSGGPGVMPAPVVTATPFMQPTIAPGVAQALGYYA